MKIFLTIFLLLNSLIGADASRILGVYDERPSWFNPKISVSACYASCCHEYLLLQRQDDGVWGVPGGKVEGEESSFNAVIREFFEETRISLEENSVGYTKTVYISDPKKDFIFHIYVFNFWKIPEVILCEREHQAYAWKTLQESLGMPLLWGEKEVFERYVEFKIRIHNFLQEYLDSWKHSSLFDIPLWNHQNW